MKITQRGSWFVAFTLVVGVGGCGNSAGTSNPGTDGTQVPINGCASETRAPTFIADLPFTGRDGTVVKLSSLPAPPAVGDNEWSVTVADSTGAPVEGAALHFTQLMPDHGHHGVKNPTVEDLGGGKYTLSPVNFNMQGFWINTVEVKTDTLDSQVELKVCVLP
jgi:hypothetical protein